MLWPFWTILGVTEILCSFRLVLERKTGKKILETSRLEFLEKFLANNFALSNAEDNTSRPFNRGCVTDLSLFRALLAICQKSWEPSFWEVMNSFVLLADASLASSKTLSQGLLAFELYFNFRRFILLVPTKKVVFMNYGSSRSSW